MNLYNLNSNNSINCNNTYNNSFIYSNFNNTGYISNNSIKVNQNFWKQTIKDVYDKKWFWENVYFIFGVSKYISKEYVQVLSAITNYFNNTQENYLPNNLIVLNTEDIFIKLIEKQYNIDNDNYHFISIILLKNESKIIFCSINVEEVVDILKETMKLFYKSNYNPHPNEQLDKRARDNIKNQNYYDIYSEINTNKKSYYETPDKKYNNNGDSKYRRSTKYTNKGNEQIRECYKNIRNNRPGLYERIHQFDTITPYTSSINSLDSNTDTNGVFYKINYGGVDNSIIYEI